MKSLLLIDALGQVFKSYYAFFRSDLKNTAGYPTGAIYGFFKGIFSVIKDIQPTHLCITWDSKTPLRRKELFPEYKNHRMETPQDLVMQMVEIYSFLAKENFPLIHRDGFEADDIIASIVESKKNEYDEIYIYSSDKDLLQLIHQNVYIIVQNTQNKKYEKRDATYVEEKFGVQSHQLRDYLAIRGDASDGVPGIRGIGEKTASKLLQTYGNIENILAHSDELPKKQQEMFLNQKDMLALSTQLVTLELDAVVWNEIDQSRWSMANIPVEALKRQFRLWEFRDIAEKEWEKIFPAYFSKAKKGERLFEETREGEDSVDSSLTENRVKQTLISLESWEEHHSLWEQFLISVEAKKELYFLGQIEITPDYTQAYWKKAWFLGDKNIYLCSGHFVSHPDWKQSLLNMFTRKDIVKVSNHGKPYFLWAKIQGAPYLESFIDIDIFFYLLHAEKKTQDMAFIYETEYHQEVEKEQLEPVFLSVLPELHRKYDQELREKNMYALWETEHLPLIPLLCDMEYLGIQVDITVWDRLASDFEIQLENVASQIYTYAGQEFNLNSPKQVGSILYEHLALESKGKKTIHGYTTDEAQLEKMIHLHPIVKELLLYRKLSKLYSTYIQKLPSYVHQGVIHTKFSQMGTATGRFSSHDPNLQNIPIRGEYGSQIRQGFVAREGYLFLGADYSQMELRLFAHYSQDPHLMDAFQQDRDIHIQTAAYLFGKEREAVTAEERSLAKTINFGILYGMGVHKLSQDVKISYGEAKYFLEEYFKTFPEVQKYIEKVKEQAWQQGYVETLSGHRRHLVSMKEEKQHQIAAEERIAVNTIIQGSGADMMRKCIVSFGKEFPPQEARLILQIHDEFIFEIREDRVEYWKEKISSMMENIVSLRVPMKVNIQVAKHWGGLK